MATDQNSGSSSGPTTTAYTETLLAAANAPAARVILGTGSPIVDGQQTQLRNADLSVVTGSFTIVSGTIYTVYLGYTTRALTLIDLESSVLATGAGAQTAEIAFASTTSGPDGTAKTFTKIVATGSLDALTSTGFKGAASPLSQAVAAGVHLWGSSRYAMASGQPSTMGLCGDHGRGQMQTTAGAAALTGLSTWVGVVPTTYSSAAVGPDLRALVSG